jgi:hypothetical protein
MFLQYVTMMLCQQEKDGADADAVSISIFHLHQDQE